MPTRFFIYSPGRAGSTAIASELSGARAVFCFQEPFIKVENLSQERREETIRQYQRHGIRRTANYNVAEQKGQDIYNYGTVAAVDPAMTAARYLDLLENHEAHTDKQAIGFKAVKSQIEAVPRLWSELAKRRYIVFCLTRRNFVKGALSAAIAQQKGLYNTTDPKRVEMYREQPVSVSIPVLKNFVREYRRARWTVPLYLRRRGFRPHNLYYEDFLADRARFYERVFKLLKVPFEMPPHSNVQKLVPTDIREFIENYAEVEAFLKRRFLLGKLELP